MNLNKLVQMYIEVDTVKCLGAESSVNESKILVPVIYAWN